MNYKTYNKLVRVRILPLILLLAAARANADCSLSDPTVHVRRDIYHLAKTPAGQATIDSLRKGVSAMMRRPESDPTSWLSQANIHGIAPGDATHPLELWSNCQHGSFFFFRGIACIFISLNEFSGRRLAIRTSGCRTGTIQIRLSQFCQIRFAPRLIGPTCYTYLIQAYVATTPIAVVKCPTTYHRSQVYPIQFNGI